MSECLRVVMSVSEGGDVSVFTVSEGGDVSVLTVSEGGDEG